MKKVILTIIGILTVGLGWLFIEKPVPPFLGATKDVQLMRDYSYATHTYSTPSGDLEPMTYAYEPLGNTKQLPGDYLYVDSKGNYQRSHTIPVGYTEAIITGEKAYYVYRDPETGDVYKDRITKAEYDLMATSNTQPPIKTISKPITWGDVFGIPKAYAAISRHCTLPADSTESGTGCQYKELLSGTSMTISYDAGSATNRVLAVATSTPGNPTGGITYNGTAVTRRVDSHFQVVWEGIWILDDPSTGANNLVISSGGALWFQMVVVSFDGADTYGDTDSGFGTTANPTLTALSTTTTDSFLFVSIGTNLLTAATNAGQNIIIENEVVTGTQGMNTSDRYFNSAAQHDMGYTFGTDQWDFVGIEIKGDGLAAAAAGKPRRLNIHIK